MLETRDDLRRQWIVPLSGESLYALGIALVPGSLRSGLLLR